jgi:prepilin-type N-terminal cleavage/methylation domain-containing protein
MVLGSDKFTGANAPYFAHIKLLDTKPNLSYFSFENLFKYLFWGSIKMPNHMSCHMNLHSTDKKGFTFIELIVVIMIIGILASIALMQLLTFLGRGYNATLQSDLRSVYTASIQFHLDYPNDAVTEDQLKEYGYTPSDEHVKLTVVDGSEATLIITAAHPGTPNVYQVDHTGSVSKQ